MGLFRKKQVEELEDSNTYEIDFTCENCDEENLFDVPKGITVDKFLEATKCDNCGCELK